MANRRGKQNNWVSVALTIIAVVIVFFRILNGDAEEPAATGAQTPTPSPTVVAVQPTDPDEQGMTLSVLEVGKADCLVLQCDGESMIIDGGNEGDEEYILAQLKNMGISWFKYLVATHPHEDHIGSLDAVIYNYPVGTAILSPREHTTRSYENLLTALSEREVETVDAKRGDTYALGGATITILSPDESDDWENINDWSVVMMVQYGRVKYLLTGDAETPVESYLLENNADLSADVLKMGHHGSNTSSKKTFLNAVHPTLALITCDKTEKAGEPNAKVVARLEELGVPYLRTDLCGVISVYTDGEDIAVTTEREDAA